jgi:hypothetical protein
MAARKRPAHKRSFRTVTVVTVLPVTTVTGQAPDAIHTCPVMESLGLQLLEWRVPILGGRAISECEASALKHSDDTPGCPGHVADPRWIAGRQLCKDATPRMEVPADRLCIAAIGTIFAPA